MADYKGYLAALLLGIIIVWLFGAVKNTLSTLQSHVLGPKLAKITTFWKLVNFRNGTYITKLRHFHKYGGVVQIGPREYSVSNPRLIHQRCEPVKVVPERLLMPQQAIDNVKSTLQMANIFRYEPLLERCNSSLLQALAGHAENEDQVNLSELIARYAYDTMFCTTTGSTPGFLEEKRDISSLMQAIETWKFYAILYGSYLRFHPTITKILQWFGIGRTLKRAIAKHLATDQMNDYFCIANELHSMDDASSDHAPSNLGDWTLEAAIALMTSGADPVITHLLASIYFTYREAKLVQALRDEIEKTGISQPPKIKELIHAKAQMPLLHAVLEESLRLIKIPASSLVSPRGGVTIGHGQMPEGCTICCEPSLAHVNPHIFGTDAETFNPSRWLEDSEVASGFRNHMIAFGAGTDTCPGKDFHLSIVAKVFTQIISYFDFEMASVDTLASPVNMTLNDFKSLTIAKVVLPKYVKLTDTGLKSPLRATAPAFAPETTTGPELPPGFTPMKLSFDEEDGAVNANYKTVGSYATRFGDVPEFVPKAMAHGGSSDSTSPTLSVATTSKSSDISSTPMTWSDEQLLEDLAGRQVTNQMLTAFDPTSELTPGPLLKTGPIPEPRNRYLLHDVIERVWNCRLSHETSRRDNCMYVWVPGTRLPAWLNKVYQTRHRNDRRKAADHKVEPTIASSTAAPTKAPRAVNPIWSNFAQDENARYTKVAAMSGDEYVAAERKKIDENGEKQTEDTQRNCIFKETFKQTGTNAKNGALLGLGKEVSLAVDGTDDMSTAVNDTVKSEPKTAVVPPHLRARAATPPHLRNKSVDTEGTNGTKDLESESEKGVWCAAKLPSPCSSD